MFGRNQGAGAGGGRGVCKFFLEGRCKFGDGCKNEHPRGQGGHQSTSNSNRFAPLSNGGSAGRGSSSSGGDRYRPGENRTLPFQLDRDSIRKDVTIGGTDGEKPTWPLSAYGPGKDAPLELIDAEFEKSPEELRVLYYIARASGDPQILQEYEQGETALVDRANQKAQHILHNLDDAITYILNGENTEQNRNKQVMSNSTPWQRPPIAASSGGSIGSLSRPQNSFAAFGQPSQPAGAGAFGRPSVLSGSGASTGGAAFGAPSIPGIQSSPFGTPAVRPAFGTPSAFGIAAQPQSSGFGAPSSLGNQPSPFAAASQNNPQTSSGPGSVFGGGSNGGQTNAFAAPKAAIPSFATLGQSPHLAGSTAFGQASQLGGGGGFGQASSAGGGGGFGQAPTIAKPLQSSSPFAQASGSSSQSSTSVGFGAPSLPGTSSGFGASSQPGSSNPFGMRSQPANNAFAAAHPTSFPGVPQPATNGLGNASDTTRDSSGRLLKWKGRPVQYNGDSVPFYQHPGTGKRERIWIEKGQPPSHPDFEGVIEAYEGERGTMLKTIYNFLGETGTFKDGLVPEIPPKRDWIRWDV